VFVQPSHLIKKIQIQSFTRR